MWLICQDESDVYADSGDSGAAMFRWYFNHVDWAGQFHATHDVLGVRYSYSSPVWAVESDQPYFARN